MYIYIYCNFGRVLLLVRFIQQLFVTVPNFDRSPDYVFLDHRYGDSWEQGQLSWAVWWIAIKAILVWIGSTYTCYLKHLVSMGLGIQGWSKFETKLTGCFSSWAVGSTALLVEEMPWTRALHTFQQIEAFETLTLFGKRVWRTPRHQKFWTWQNG